MYFAFKYLLAGAAMLGLSLATVPGASALTVAPIKLSMDAGAPVELARSGGGGGHGMQIRRFGGGGGKGFARGSSGGRGFARGPSNRGMYYSGNRGRGHANVGGPRLRKYANYDQRYTNRQHIRRSASYGGYKGGQYNEYRKGRKYGNYPGGYSGRREGRHSGRYDGRHGKWNHYDPHHHGHRYKHKHGHYKYYHDGWWYGWPWWTGVGIGIGIGSYWGDYWDEPVYGAYDAHVEWCLRRYRSYDPATDVFLGYDGRYHRCISPYG